MIEKVFYHKKVILEFALALMVACAIFAFIFLKGTGQAGAQMTAFYPAVCLGGWNNVGLASGPPDAIANDTYQYTEQNSATLHNSTAQIFCGEFRGELPPDALHNRVVLRLSWSVEDVVAETLVPESAVSEVMVETPPPAPAVPAEVLTEAEIVPAETVPVEIAPAPVDEVISVEEVEVNAVESASGEPLSFWYDWLATPAQAEASLAFEVLFTLDGSTWLSLGYTADISQDTEFELPLEMFKSVSDLERVQIALQPVQNFDSVSPKVYLDALWLEVDYRISQVETENPIHDQEESFLESLFVEPVAEEDFSEEQFLEDEEEVSNEPSLEPVIESPPLTVRNFNKIISLDPDAVHNCEAEKFYTDISNTEFSQIALAVTPAQNVQNQLEIGSLPLGIDIRFTTNNLYTYSLQGAENRVDLSVISQAGSQKGNFTIPIVYTQIGESDSTVVCQVNLVNE